MAAKKIYKLKMFSFTGTSKRSRDNSRAEIDTRKSKCVYGVGEEEKVEVND